MTERPGDHRILADHTGLGEAGRALLSRQIGGSVVIVAPVRSGSDPPFSAASRSGERPCWMAGRIGPSSPKTWVPTR